MTSQNPRGRIVDIAKFWAKIFSSGSLKLLQIPGRVKKSTDIQRIDKLREEMRPEVARDPATAAKYADYSYWFSFNVPRVASLSLHDSKPLKLLDVGCGPGYFLAAARACGHDVYGVDVPAHIMNSVEKRVYSELLGSMSLTPRVSPLLIEKYTPMSLPHRDLDLITAFWICFNRHRQPDEWGPKEWGAWVDDALSYLRPGGVIHLELNAHPERYKDMQWYDTETLKFFRSVGTVERNVVRIHKK